MKRRDFIKMTSAAGAAVLTGTAEVAEAKSLTPAEMDGFLGRLDKHLDGISRAKLSSDLFPDIQAPKTDDERAWFKRGDELFKKAMRSLLLVGVVHDLPEPSRIHPGMQERLWAAIPEMDDALYGMMDLLDELTPADRIDIAETIRDDPGLPMRVIEALDREGASIGISTKRRLHLRSLGAQVAWRIRSQSPSAVIDEYADKTRRVVARYQPHPEVLQKLAARFGERALFGMQSGTLFAAAGDEVMYASGDSPAPAPAPPGPPPNSRMKDALERAHKGQRVMTAGAWCLGISLGLTGIGLGLGFTVGWPFLIVATIGALLFLAGLITLIVGGSIRYRADRDLEESS